MKTLIFILSVVSLSAFGADNPKGSWTLDKAHAIAKKKGFDPGKQIEQVTGLKVAQCGFVGKKLKLISPDLGKCLIYAFFDFDRTGIVSPIEISALSASGKEIHSTLNWTPVEHRIELSGWERFSATNYIMRRLGELKILRDNYLMNEVTLDFAPALTVGDLKLPGAENFMNVLTRIHIERMKILTYPVGEQNTLSGMMELSSAGEGASVLRILFDTDWKVGSVGPVKAQIKGRLIPFRSSELNSSVEDKP